MKNILIEQNKHWDGQKYSSTPREALKKLIDYLPLKQIITITGIRRCGKSTLAKQAIGHLIENSVLKENILFVNLENPYFIEYRHNTTFLEIIFEEYLKMMNPKGRIYCIFDEIQYFDNWQLFVKNKYETSDIKFIITGSNSSLLSNDLNTLLSGRSLNINLHTFSFTEFLTYKEIEYKSEYLQIKNRIDIARTKDEYLQWGGFYEVFAIEDTTIKKELLAAYAKNIIYQDIVPRYAIRNSEIVERLFFYLLVTATKALNYTTLAKSFDVSDKTIKEYINYFEDVFLLKRIDKFHTKLKEKIKSTKKIYACDNGFLQIAPKETKNLGTSLENSVFLELSIKNSAITYVKEKYEIDFKTKKTLYQIAYNIDNEKTKNREIRAFQNIDGAGDYKHKIITYNTSKTIDTIEVMKFEEFALEL